MGLGKRFSGGKRGKNAKAKARAMDQSLRPSGFSQAFGRMVSRFAAGFDAGLKSRTIVNPYPLNVSPPEIVVVKGPLFPDKPTIQ